MCDIAATNGTNRRRGCRVRANLASGTATDSQKKSPAANDRDRWLVLFSCLKLARAVAGGDTNSLEFRKGGVKDERNLNIGKIGLRTPASDLAQ